MKKKPTLLTLSIVLLVTAFLLATTAYFVYASKEKETITVQRSIDKKEDVQITKLALEEIHETIHLSSHSYDYSFDYILDGLKEDANWLDKTAYAVAGKKLTILAHVSFEMKTDLAFVTKDDVAFDEKTGLLTVRVPYPKMDVTYNEEKTKKDDENSRVALFSSGYDDEAILRSVDDIVSIAESEIATKAAEDVEQAEQDIKDGLKGFLSLIPGVKNVEVEFSAE